MHWVNDSDNRKTALVLCADEKEVISLLKKEGKYKDFVVDYIMQCDTDKTSLLR